MGLVTYKELAKATKLKQEEVRAVIDAIAEALIGENDVVLLGLGQFNFHRREARRFKTPLIKGGVAKIPPGLTVRFKFSPTLRYKIRGKDTRHGA